MNNSETHFYIRFLFFILASSMFFHACSEPEITEKDPRPNIILIVADDLGFSDLGCYGGEIRTPNIDRLAKQGIRFTQFYNASHSSASRAALLTGLYPHQAGIGDTVQSNKGQSGPYQGYLSYESATLAEVLKHAGYTTLMSGKWHVGKGKPDWPLHRGFDRYFGLINGESNYFSIHPNQNRGETPYMALDNEPYYPTRDSFYMTDICTEYALHFIQEVSNEAKPFFLYLAYTAPHLPLHAWQEDIARYEKQYKQGWDKIREQRYQKQLALGLMDSAHPLPPKDQTVSDWDQLSETAQRILAHKMAVYAAQTYRMDQGIGQILTWLKSNDQLDNTLILFLSDNGANGHRIANPAILTDSLAWAGQFNTYQSYGKGWAHVSNTPFKNYKYSLHEGGIRTPFIAYWPKVLKSGGHFQHTIQHTTDIIKTCCEAAKTRYPDTLDGRAIKPSPGMSILPILHGDTIPQHKLIYWEYAGHRAMRDEAWKLVAEKGRAWELYNLEKDPFERSNLAWRYYYEITKPMITVYQNWADSMGVENK